jgi:hypothetical protein
MVTVAREPFLDTLLNIKLSTNIPVATNDIDGPEGRFKKYER